MTLFYRAIKQGVYQIFHLRSERPLSRQDASSRISAFVYGDILILAALIALYPEDLLGLKAVSYIVGTGVSTYFAHVLAQSIGSSVETDDHPLGGHLRQEVWHAAPIASAALGPTLFMVAALLGWIGPDLALQLAILVTVIRLAGLGWVVGHLRGERVSVRTLLLGIILAVLCVAAALLKTVATD
ncbi:hypothetical protein [Arthrobacter sp. CG_A4]|uniref:hypothetical protein n=1 Tax=Arthrobacter sp. CG_A4 TaxID=3071706 RepID=UPI002E0ACD62|nr:hypothetical protein [Arthrobacter sp. CG_A4]